MKQILLSDAEYIYGKCVDKGTDKLGHTVARLISLSNIVSKLKLNENFTLDDEGVHFHI